MSLVPAHRRSPAAAAENGPGPVSSSLPGARQPAGDRLAHTALLAVAVVTAWRPAELFPSTAPLLTVAVLLLLPWGWRCPPVTRQRWVIVGLGALWLGIGLLAGWDRARAVDELALVGVAVALAWLAARRAPPEIVPPLLALGLAGLALWGLWQVTAGADALQAAASELEGRLGELAVQRLATGRAFASLALPSHLAVALATAVPVLVAAARRRRPGALWWGAGLVCGGGIVLTRSVAGATLAVVGLAAVLLHRRGARPLVWVACAVALLGSVLALRGDLAELGFVRLRLDNWRTALWVWSTAPVTGVGLGGVGQASQGVPLMVGNLPAHAHCLPLEWAAEMGLPGLAAAVALIVWVGRLARRVAGHDVGLAAAITIVPLHNLVDFSCFSSGVLLPWAVLVGWAVAVARRGPPPDTTLRGRAAAVVLAALAVAAGGLHASSRTVERAAASLESAADRLELALAAHRLAPWRLQPVFLAGRSALALGTRAAAEEGADVVRGASWLRPHSSALAGLAADLAAATGDRGAAATRAWAARHPGVSPPEADEPSPGTRTPDEAGP